MRRLIKFLLRHGWSLPLGILSVLCFAQLAWEVREQELGPIDEAISRWLQASRGDWDTLMLILTHSGGERGMTTLCVSTVLGMLLLKQRKAATFAAIGGIGAWLLSAALKLLFARARPEATTHYLIPVPSSFSFPSGHALGTTCVVGCVVVIVHALRAPRVWRVTVSGFAALYVVGVAISRVYFGVHYPSDVLGGQLAGAAWVAALTGYFYPRLLPGEATAPTSNAS